MTAAQLLKTFANTLRMYRRQRSLGQLDLSKKLRFNYRHLQSIEAGKVDLKYSTINSFARALDVPACYLLENSKDHQLRKINFPCPSAILDALPIGIQVADTSGLILYANKKHAQSLELPAHQLVELKYVWDFLAEESDKKKLKEYLESLVRQQPEPSPYFAKSKQPGGEFLPIKLDWNYIRDHHGKLVGLISIVQYHPSW